jgi:hypothetical protein
MSCSAIWILIQNTKYCKNRASPVTNRLSSVGFKVFTAVVINRRFGVKYRLHLQGRINQFSKNQQAGGKLEAICSSETSVETQRTTRRHIPEDYTLQTVFCLAS